MDIKNNRKIQVGMFWDIDGHNHEIKSVNGDRCIVAEDWISEDTFKQMHHEEEYGIEIDENGTEYVYALDYPKWKLYSTSAFNYPLEEKDKGEDDIPSEWYGDDPDPYGDNFTVEEDYSPSCPWNAPGMRVSDFI